MESAGVGEKVTEVAGKKFEGLQTRKRQPKDGSLGPESICASEEHPLGLELMLPGKWRLRDSSGDDIVVVDEELG